MSREWLAELGVGEEAIVLDLGACPWCGEYAVEVAPNGLAVGRKPPDMCCLAGTMAALGRIRAGLAAMKAAAKGRPKPVRLPQDGPDEIEVLEAYSHEVARYLARIAAGRMPSEVEEAMRQAKAHTRLKVKWDEIVAVALRR